MALNLSAGQSWTQSATPPYLAVIDYAVGDDKRFAVSRNASNAVIVQEEAANWVFSSDNQLIFSSDNQLIIGAQ